MFPISVLDGQSWGFQQGFRVCPILHRNSPALKVQVSVLRLLGTSLYPFIDSLLIAGGIQHKLLRYRIHMNRQEKNWWNRSRMMWGCQKIWEIGYRYIYIYIYLFLSLSLYVHMSTQIDTHTVSTRTHIHNIQCR